MLKMREDRAHPQVAADAGASAGGEITELARCGSPVSEFNVPNSLTVL